MMKVRALVLGLMVLALGTMVAVSQEKEKEFPKKGGEKGKFEGKDKGGMRGGFGLLPPFIREQLDLTEEQEKKIADIEKEARDAVMEILTKEQRQKLMEFGKKGGVPAKKDGFSPKKEGEKKVDKDK